MRSYAVLILIAFLPLTAIAQPAPKPPPRPIIDDDIDRAISETKRYLWSMRNPDGLWVNGQHTPSTVFPGGLHALCTLAMLEAGESPQSPDMKKALDLLANFQTTNTYVVATRVMALSQIAAANKNSPHVKQLLSDVQWLMGATQHPGAWGYAGPEKTGDNSASQFALLALFEAQRANIELSDKTILAVEKTWLARQQPDGGWTYAGQSDLKTQSTPTMTAAGLASLFICQELGPSALQKYPHQKPMDASWNWLAQNLPQNFASNGYLAFTVQRIGMTGGAKFIGELDWQTAALSQRVAPNPQGRSYAGTYGPVVEAAFELIFLARSQLPLTINKLQYGQSDDWNFYPRDAFRFTEYVRRNFERRLRWQTVKITDDVSLLLDAPILLINGPKDPAFTPQQWQKLRDYTLSGGTLLFTPTNPNPAFSAAIKAALPDLYASDRQTAGGYYTLEQLPETHPLYHLYEKIPNGPKLAPLWGLSDGTRLLAVLCERDICKAWQASQGRPSTSHKIDFAVATNFLFYATGGNALKMRLRPVFPPPAGEVRQTVKIGWLRHVGNCQTQPFSLQYLSQKLTAENRIALDVHPNLDFQTEPLTDFPLLWMTGSTEFALTDPQLAVLRQYIQDGGTLFVNAVGGSKDFSHSAQRMLETLFQGTGIAPAAVSLTSPLMTGKLGDYRGPVLTSLQRTKAALTAPGTPLTVYEKDGRTLAILATLGIHDTMDGHTAHDAASFMPPSARDIAENIVLYALMPKPKVSLTPPPRD